MSVGVRNPGWTRDEWLLALDFYLRHRHRLPGKASAEVKALSEELRRLRGSLAGLPREFRNPAGVEMQIYQFAGFDRSHKAKGTHPTKLAREVWDSYAGDAARVSAIADRIREGIVALDFSIPTTESLGVSEAREGRVLTYQHVRRERDPRLTRRKKEQFQDEHRGRLFCEVCAFDYERSYGEHGKGFIEAHHLRPLSELPREGGRIRLADLILLCANCHRMIHRHTPWLTPEALQSTLILSHE